MCHGQPALENVQLDLKKELISGDLLHQPAGVSGVEFDAQVQGDRGQTVYLPTHPFRRVHPVCLVALILVPKAEKGCLDNVQIFENVVDLDVLKDC